MRVRTDKEVNGITARYLREKAGMSQRDFWDTLGASQTAGSHYEQGKRPIPQSLKTLLFIKYEAGLKFDTGTVEGAEKLRTFIAAAAA